MKKLLSKSGIFVLSSVLFLLVCPLGCHQYLASPHSQEWDSFVSNFIESYFIANPDVAVWAGRHEFDGNLRDFSKKGLKNRVEQLNTQRKRAIAFDSNSLSASQLFERDYITVVIDTELFWLDTAQWTYKCPSFYLDALDPRVYVTREYAPLAKRMHAYIKYARNVPTAVEQIRSNLQTPLPRTYIEVGQTIFGGLASHYEQDVPIVFASVEDIQLQEEFREANAAAIKAMKSLSDWLKDQIPNATEDFALGPVVFLEMLWSNERIKIGLKELKAIGEKDLKRNLDALKDTCERYAPGKSIQECVELVQANKPGDGPLEKARHQLKELRSFVTKKNIVTIPGSEDAIVKESPPYQRWNFALIDIIGPYEMGLPSIYYISPPDTSWSEEDRKAYIPCEATLLMASLHEVWPGHFLQFLHAKQSRSKVGQVFYTYSFTEGWAHYTEEMMWEAGFGNGDSEVHIGQLLEALLRDVRYLSAIGLHTEGMTVEESQRMFREFAFQDPANARQQAARGTFDPGYLCYTLGKLMIIKLRDDWMSSRGERQAWRAFHDHLLSYGGPPISLVRKAMLGSEGGSLF